MEDRREREAESSQQRVTRGLESAESSRSTPQKSRYMQASPDKPAFFRNEEQDQVARGFSNVASACLLTYVSTIDIWVFPAPFSRGILGRALGAPEGC
jgi:hypothetical protein